jgi:hypothetical protein
MGISEKEGLIQVNPLKIKKLIVDQVILHYIA